MGITLGGLALNKVTKYRMHKSVRVGIKSIPRIAESGQLIDGETYSFHRPEYFIKAKLTDRLRDQIQRMYEDQTAHSYNDGIQSDSVQVASIHHEYEVGYDEHLMTMKLLGSAT